jgi:hypothetical protein
MKNPPEIPEEPFFVTVESVAPVSYQWLVNGWALPGATNVSLVLSGPTLSDNGDYSVVISNTYGTVTSAVAILTVWEALSVGADGRGTVGIEPGPYTFGDIVSISATAARWSAFGHWSDGSTDNPRRATIGVTNRYTAIFINTVPLEWWTNQVSGQTWQVPVGTPEIYVNGQLTFGGSFFQPDTNLVEVRMQTRFDGDFILYTLDGSEPTSSGIVFVYLEPFPVTEPVVLRATAFDGASLETSPADPVTIGFLRTLRGWTKGGGDVQVEPRSPAYASNAVVTLTAIASNGWEFLFWAGDASDTKPVLSVTMDSRKTIEAVFGTFLTTGPAIGRGRVARTSGRALAVRFDSAAFRGAADWTAFRMVDRRGQRSYRESASLHGHQRQPDQSGPLRVAASKHLRADGADGGRRRRKPVAGTELLHERPDREPDGGARG